MITESASATKIIPMSARSNSRLKRTAETPSIPPNANEPVSPIKTCAGDALYHKNPRHAPIMAERKIATSPDPG